MNRLWTFLALISLVWVSPSVGGGPEPFTAPTLSCDWVLAEHTNHVLAAEAEPSSTKRDLLSNVRKLREKIYGQLEIRFRNPFLFAQDLNHRIQIWQEYNESLSRWTKANKLPGDLLERSLKFSQEVEVNPQSAEFRKLVRDIERVSKALIKDESSDLDTVYTRGAVLEAIRRCENYIQRGEETKQLGPLQNEELEDTSDVPPPFYPDKPPAYQARHVDVDPSKRTPTKRESIAKVNEPNVAWFRMGHYTAINARTGEWWSQELPFREAIQRDPAHRRVLELKPLNATGQWKTALIPEGYEPVSGFSDEKGTLVMNKSGEWNFKTDETSLEVPLVKVNRRIVPLSPIEIETYVQPTGVEPKEWPHKELQKALGALDKIISASGFEKESLRNPKIAALLQKVIISLFEYEFEGSQNTDPLHWVSQGKLQCSTAVTLALSLLREKWNIPSRIVALAPGFHLPDENGFSHVVSPEVGHVQIEVADEFGEWHKFDFTPPSRKKKSPKETQMQDEFKRNPGDEELGQSIDIESQGLSVPGESGAQAISEISTSGMPEEVQQSSGVSDESEESHGGAGKGKGGARKKQGKKGSSNSESTMSWEEVIGHVEERFRERERQNQENSNEVEVQSGTQSTGSESEVEEEQEQLSASVLAGRFVRGLILDCLLENVPVQEKRACLQRLQGQVIRANANMAAMSIDDAMSWIQDAMDVFLGDYPSFSEWFSQIPYLAQKGELREASNSLFHLNNQLVHMRSLLDPDDRGVVTQMIEKVARAMELLSTTSSKDAKLVSLADELYEVLGKPSREWLQKTYRFDEIGDNAGTKRFGRKLARGEHTDLRLRGLLSPYTDFVAHPVRVPRYGESRAPFEGRRVRAPQFTLSQDMREAIRYRGHLPNGMTPIQAARLGILPVEIQPERIRTQTGGMESGNKKMLIVIWDTSGSMGGNRGFFVQEYLKALVDRAGTDLDENGNMNQEIIFIPFGTQVGNEIEVTNPDEVEQAIASASGFGNTGSGTDIEAPLLNIPNLVHKKMNGSAEKRRKLSRISVVLFTDGEGEVRPTKVSNAWGHLRGKSDLLFTYVATGAVNSSLVELATEKSKSVSDRGNFFHWPDDEIAKMIELSEMSSECDNEFWNTGGWDSLGTDVQKPIEALSQTHARVELPWWGEIGHIQKLRDIESRSFSPTSSKVNKERKRELKLFRQFIEPFGEFQNRQERMRSLQWVGKRWESLVGGGNYSAEEIAELHWILYWIENGTAYDI